jgi:cell division transport system permease protein
MLKRDIAFKSDANRAFLPFVCGFMVFMTVIVAATAFVGHAIARDWDGKITSSVTIQIMPNPAAKNQQADMEARINGVKKILSETPGVQSFGAVSLEETQEMLRPFLGDIRNFDITVPRIVTVEASKKIQMDMPKLKKTLSDYSSLVRIESFEQWTDGLISALSASEAVLGAIVALILATIAATIAYATRASMVSNANVIEVMHTVGASSTYISGLMSNQMTKAAAAGGGAGYAAGIAAIALIRGMASGMDEGLVSGISFPAAAYAWLLLVPAISCAITKATAELVVRRALKRMI